MLPGSLVCMVDRDFLNRWRPEQEKINKNKAVE